MTSCQTYTLSVSSFKQQMADAKTAAIEDGLMAQRFIDTENAYSASLIDSIRAIDKNGNVKYLENIAAVESRFTLKNGKRYVVYFDTLFLLGDTLTGGRSRFFPDMQRSLHMDSIAKIELQNAKRGIKSNSKQ